MAKPKTITPISELPEKGQPDLPGMENRAIEELETAARRYAAIRDKRMALNDAETKLQDLLMGLLKKHGKREYKHDNIEIWIKVEEEKVKVRVKDEDESPSERRNSAISDQQNAGGTDRTDQGATGGSQGTSDQGQAEDRQTQQEAGEAGSAEGEDIPF
jgi:hypothetical protein